MLLFKINHRKRAKADAIRMPNVSCRIVRLIDSSDFFDPSIGLSSDLIAI